MSSIQFNMLESEEEMPTLDPMTSIDDNDPIDLIDGTDQSFCFKDDLSDVTIECNGSRFPAHKLILAKKSDVLMAHFKSNDNYKIIELTNCEVEAVKQFIGFIYGKPLVWDRRLSTAGNLVRLAKIFNVFDLGPVITSEVAKAIENCPDFMKPDLFCELIRFIDDNNMDEIRSKVMAFGAKNIDDILHIELLNFRSKDDILMLINKFSISPSKIIKAITPQMVATDDVQRIKDYEELINLGRCTIGDLLTLCQRGLFEDHNLMDLAKFRVDSLGL